MIKYNNAFNLSHRCSKQRYSDTIASANSQVQRASPSHLLFHISVWMAGKKNQTFFFYLHHQFLEMRSFENTQCILWDIKRQRCFENKFAENLTIKSRVLGNKNCNSWRWYIAPNARTGKMNKLWTTGKTYFFKNYQNQNLQILLWLLFGSYKSKKIITCKYKC